MPMDAWRDRLEQKLDSLLETVTELKVKLDQWQTIPRRVEQVEQIIVKLDDRSRNSTIWEKEAEKRIRDLENTIIKSPEKLEERVRSLEDNRTSNKGALGLASGFWGFLGGALAALAAVWGLFHSH